jgi:hypothetical protein
MAQISLSRAFWGEKSLQAENNQKKSQKIIRLQRAAL